MQSKRRMVLTKGAVFASICVFAACGGESEKPAVAPEPVPVVTASVAPASATSIEKMQDASTSANASLPSAPPFALVEAPRGDLCTFEGEFRDGISLRAHAAKDSPDLFFVDAPPSNQHATLVAPEMFFVDLDLPSVHARGFTLIEEMRVNRVFTFRDVLTIDAGASVSIGATHEGHVTLTPEIITWLAWVNDVPTVDAACADLTFKPSAPPTGGKPGATFVDLTGTHDVFAKTDAAPIAMASDAGLLAVIATKPGFLKLQSDFGFSHLSFWVNAAGLKPRRMTRADFLTYEANRMQMQMLASFNGMAVSGVVGAINAGGAPARASTHCASITLAFGPAAKAATPIATLKNVDLAVREAEDALIRVELPSHRNAAWYAERGMQAFARREDLDACKALP